MRRTLFALATLLLVMLMAPWSAPAQVNFQDARLAALSDAVAARSPQYARALTTVKLPVWVRRTPAVSSEAAGRTTIYYANHQPAEILVEVSGDVNLTDEELTRILVHELYGHAIPPAATRRTADLCADPVPGERYPQSCVAIREAGVLRDLQLSRRLVYARH